MTAFLGTLLARLVASGVLERALGLIEQRQDAAGERERLAAGLAAEAVRAEMAARQAAREVLLAEQGRWWTALPRPLFAVPLGIWWSAVIADSLCGFRWDVAALPPPLDEWAGIIVAALFLVDGGERIARAIRRRRG